MVKQGTVYNFFKFLEDKRGEKLPLKLKLLHFFDKVDREEVRDKLGNLIYKLIYEPDNLTEDDLHVKGNLDLSYLPITEIPNNLIIDGWLSIVNTRIKKLPDNIKIKKDLYASSSQLEEIPDNFQVKTLGCNDTPIKDVPYNLKVESSFYCMDTPLAEKYTDEEIRKMIEDKGGYVKWKVRTGWL